MSGFILINHSFVNPGILWEEYCGERDIIQTCKTLPRKDQLLEENPLKNLRIDTSSWRASHPSQVWTVGGIY